jgi:phage terminase small subunit
LTQKQETFCQLIVRGTNRSASDCYRDAYDASKSTKKTINENVSRLMSDPKVAARIEELRAPVVKQTQYDLAWCLDAQAEARDLGLQTGNAGAASAAAREIGKLGGIYPSEKTEMLVTVDVVGRLHAGRDRVKDMKVIN